MRGSADRRARYSGSSVLHHHHHHSNQQPPNSTYNHSGNQLQTAPGRPQQQPTPWQVQQHLISLSTQQILNREQQEAFASEVAEVRLELRDCIAAGEHRRKGLVVQQPQNQPQQPLAVGAAASVEQQLASGAAGNKPGAHPEHRRTRSRGMNMGQKISGSKYLLYFYSCYFNLLIF